MVRYDVHFIPASIACLALGALIGAAQAIGWPISRFHPSSSRWPACWCSKGWRLRCCKASRSAVLADLPETLLRFHSGTFPGAGALYPLAPDRRHAGACLVYVSVKTRARRASHGVEVEPTGFFALKNATLFGVIIYFTYLIASHRGCPTCCDHIALIGSMASSPRAPPLAADLCGRR